MSLAHDDHLDAPTLTGPGPSLAGVEDFVALLKPRVMSLVIFTALVGLVAAPGGLHPVLGAIALLCVAVGAGASGALNMWWDADIDAVMTRTQNRPIPAGRVAPGEALGFGLLLSGVSVMLLGLATNWLAGGLLAFTIFFYVVVYTMWLKRWTPQNIVIGGLAGALPPMIGWAAATGTVGLESATLVAIIFMWTPPHFWALALIKSEDYARAGVPMLPVVAGEDETRKQILLYSIALAPLGVLPAGIGLGGWAYLALSSVAGLAFVGFAWRVYRQREGAPARRAAGKLFAYSLFYLTALFATILIEKSLGVAALTAPFDGWV
ncbi:heme o synthase [Methylopila sp. Yamaguchi]|uniref:heme o synthase n=1 Tax=Methylopila sp. Yamaguchi TaxID=1437817 RepID=UPI000CB69F0E|nr:heme o synthase [Methylopila sp. Yamaguchi]GBD47779.1 protoheme IX farnesyltransferase [Methylopila sp. Yamaguchi]